MITSLATRQFSTEHSHLFTLHEMGLVNRLLAVLDLCVFIERYCHVALCRLHNETVVSHRDDLSFGGIALVLALIMGAEKVEAR
jgi:hypothetical protein